MRVGGRVRRTAVRHPMKDNNHRTSHLSPMTAVRRSNLLLARIRAVPEDRLLLESDQQDSPPPSHHRAGPNYWHASALCPMTACC